MPEPADDASTPRRTDDASTARGTDNVSTARRIGNGFTARCLVRAARQASLATLQDGAPFASLLTPATSCGGDLLMLVSSLSRHARHLQKDGRCSLLISGAEQQANPQTTPRLTVTGSAVPEPDPALLDRWIRIHPYGALYAGFGDFSLWRLRPEQAYLVGGFGQAGGLAARALAAGWDVAAEEVPLVEAANVAYAARLSDGRRIVALDADGMDVGPAPSMDPNGEARTERLAFSAPAGTADALRDAIAGIFQGLPS